MRARPRPSIAPCAAILALALAAGGCHSTAAPRAERAPRPNVVVVFTDDQGYGDLSCYGHPTIHTPQIDRLAEQGAKLTQFYVAAPLCSPSRAALLTGCYPKRVGMHNHVIFPDYDYGLHTDEVTLADLLRDQGYATGCFGKWHLGHRPGLLPTDQGFDEFVGVPYSNDMTQVHRKPGNKYAFRLPMMRGREVTEWEPDQRQLTKRATDAAVDFIERAAAAGQPFFAYVPHSMPHIPLYASAAFEGTSPRGLYGDVIEEIDDSVGRITATLDRLGLTENTMVIFASDNGPWLPFKQDGGSAGPLRGGKGTNFEGGQRVPCIVRWPGRVAQGTVCRELITAMDLLPTLAAIVGAPLPEVALDGHDVRAVLTRGAPSPTEAFLYYTTRGKLAAVRRGPWKLFLENGELYQIEIDVGEQWNLAERHPDLVAELRAWAEDADALVEAEARPVRHVEESVFDPRKPGA